MSLEAIIVDLVRDNKAIHRGYLAGLVRMEKNKQGAHMKLSFPLHINSISDNNKSLK